MKIYISGKITGIENKAFGLFQEAETLLSEMGHVPVNPMKLDHNHNGEWSQYMRVDIKALCDCDAILMLENWKKSKGAIIENMIANAIGLMVFYQTDTLRQLKDISNER